jgi:hypothetical protein
MDTTGLGPRDDLSELEGPLKGLSPVTGDLSRDRMLFEAGRASAQADSRGRFLMLASAAIVVITGLGVFSFVERSKRYALENAIAHLEQRREAPAPYVIPPFSIASNDASPYSYRALSLLEGASGLHEWELKADAMRPARNSTGADSEQAPLRVRDAGKLLQF